MKKRLELQREAAAILYKMRLLSHEVFACIALQLLSFEDRAKCPLTN